jgi:uncharacterized protein
MTAVQAASLYIALNLLLLVYLGFRVVLRRVSAKVSMGTGGDAVLETRMRVHGNAAEYIPAMMIALYVIANLGASVATLHALGAGFTLGRLLHVLGLSRGIIPARQFGMILTFLSMLLAGALLFYRALA